MTSQMDGSGNLINLNMTSDVATYDRTVLYFPDAGPHSAPEGLGFGVPMFTPGAANGGITVEFTKIAPFQIDSSFTISAYVRFTSNWNWGPTTKWPFVTFDHDGYVGQSPFIWLNPDGEMIIEYSSSGATVTENLNAPPIYVGKGHSWKFVSIQYDVFTSQMKHTIIDFLGSTATFSAPITLTNKPSFNTKKMFIGSDGATNNFDGSMACFSIYNWALSATEIEQLKSACDQILGGSAAPVATAGCDGCTNLVFPNDNGMAIPDTNRYIYAPGETVTFTSAMFTQFGTGHPERERTVVCSGVTGYWDNWEDPKDYSRGCNPECLNNGNCVCDSNGCSCQCNPLFTGNDCSWIIAVYHDYMAANSTVFWPLDAQRMVSIGGVRKALDLSNNAQHLDIGKTVAFVNGPMGNRPKTAMRFRNGILYDKFLAALHGAVSNTMWASGQTVSIHFYIKFNEFTGHQTVFGYETPSGGPQSSSLGLDEAAGCFIFHDNAGTHALPCDGQLSDGDWHGIKMMYEPPLYPGTIEGRVDFQDPLFGNGPTVSLQTSSNFLIGLDNFLPLGSDLSLSCIGIYNEEYTASDNTARRHRKLCSQVHRYHCPASPTATANMVGPRYATTNVDSTIYYFCVEGYQSGGSRTIPLSCADSGGSIMFFSGDPVWSPAAPAACGVAGSCIPGCVHGTCSVNLCSCDPGWGGVNCDVDLMIFPDNCRNPFIYPLTSTFVSSTGRSKNIYNPTSAAIVNPTGLNVDWKPGDLFSNWPPAIAINNYAYSTPTSHYVNFAMTNPPFQSATSFTVSAYIKFDIVNAIYDTLYPVVTFENVWTAPSPALYIAPDGNAKMICKYGTSTYTLSLSLPSFIGIGPWAFVTFIYNSTADEVQVVLNAQNYSLPVSIGATPQFDTLKMYLGSSDTPLAGANDVFAGQIACLSLYNTPLTQPMIMDLMTACDSLLGGPAISSTENVTQCTTCYQLPQKSTSAVDANGNNYQHIRLFSSDSDVDFPIGSVVSINAPPYKTFHGDYLTVYRTLNITCILNGTSAKWSPEIPATVYYGSGPYFNAKVCDPTCMNGRCMCEPYCKCYCFPGYTGHDCQVLISNFQGDYTFVPMTKDTLIQYGTRVYIRAWDFGPYSSTYEYMTNGDRGGFDIGPFGTKDSAYRQR